MQQRRDHGGPGAAAGAPPERPERAGGGPPRGGRGRDFRSRRKVCVFCVEHVREIDYKDVTHLRRYLSDRGKIEPRRKTGTCAKHQRRLSTALKNARIMALLPYTAAHIRGS
jgi:small subunit ribosomal protein S18